MVELLYRLTNRLCAIRRWWLISISSVCANGLLSCGEDGSLSWVLWFYIFHYCNLFFPPDNKNRPLFSPRMEYNEWLPVGRGDPLKNDPTYDYSPPVLDRVRYWSENLANKDKGNDILLLGVPSKKASNQQKAIVEQQQPQQVPWGSNSGPMRRNYYHHQINQLPTVLMPPPLNNHLQPDGGDGYLWTQASTHQAQRYEGLPQGEGFRYRPQPGPVPQQQHQPQPHPGHSFQYQGEFV